MNPLFAKLNLGGATLIHVLDSPESFEPALGSLAGVRILRTVSGPVGFALAFVLMVSGYITGTFLAQRLALRVEGRRLILVGCLLQAAGGAAMLAFVFLFRGTPYAMTLPMMFYSCGVGFTLPQSMAGAMMPFPDRAGAASSLLGIMQIGFASIVGAVVGAFIDHGPLVLAGAVALFGLCAVAIYPMIRRPEATP